MADITLTTTESNIVVDASNNIIQVSSTPTTVVVGEGSTVDNAQIRAALSNVAPILYDASTGVFSFDANATFSGKTTDDLAEGSVNLYFTDARSRNAISTLNQGVGYGTLSYNNTSGVITYNVVTNANIRSALSYAAGSAGYNSSTGVISIPTTTTNLGEGTNLYFTAARARGNISVTDAGGLGSLSYNNTTGVITYTGPGDIETRNLFSVTDAGGLGSLTYSSTTGIFTYTGPSNSDITNLISVTDAGGDGSLSYSSGVITYTGPNQTEANARIAAAPNQVREHLSATNSGSGFGSIAYNNSTGVTTYTRVSNADIASSILNNTIKLKNYSETAVDYGSVAGNITVDLNLGSIHEYTLVGNVTFISFANAVAGSSATLIFKQDAVGGRQLDTTTHTWTGWEFAGNSKTLTLAANSKDVMTVIIPDTGEYYSSIVSMEGIIIPNSQLANSNVIVNGVTIALGSSGNIDTFNSNVTVNGNLNVAGNLNYQNVTDLYVTDQKITLNSNAATNSNVEIISNRPTATNTMLKWNEPATRWEFTNDGSTYYPIATSTSDLVEGTNLYFTAARARGNISAAENITYNSTTGVIGLANTLANVNGVSTETASNLTLATDKQITITTRQRNGDANSANIRGEGYALSQTGSAFWTTPMFAYSGNASLKTYVFDGDVTTGSNVITNVANVHDLQGNPASINDIQPYFAFQDSPAAAINTIFGQNAYVTGVSGSNIYISAPALFTDSFFYDSGDPFNSFGSLSPGALDTTTGLLLAFESDYDIGGANAQQIVTNYKPNPKQIYGYGANGPANTNFVYAIGTASDYTIDANVSSKFMFGRTDFSASKTVGNFRRGLTVGPADLTNRGENDDLQTFGLNIVWDGTANVEQEYGSTTGIFPQLLLKQYTDGTNQGIGGNTSVSWSGGGPRLLFAGAYGKNTNDPLSTYARANQELGSIKWLSTTSFTTSPSTIGPPAYISAVSLKDQTTGPGDVGLYLVASPTTGGTSTNQVGGATARALFVGHHKGNTIISAASRTNGTCGDIMFTPARAASNRGNAAQMAEQVSTNTVAAPQWARIGYDNPSANTGARVEVTNGFNSAGARNGNLSVIINRNDNGVGFGNKAWAYKLQPGSNDLVLTEDNVIRTTFASGGNVTVTGNINLTGRLLGYDKVYGEFCYTGGNIVPAAPDTIYAFPFDTTNMASDVVANNTSQIHITKPGTFKLITSIQVKNADNATDHIMRFWLRKNGVDVANSATLITPLKLQEQVIAMDWMVESDGDDYFEIVYYVNDVDVTFPYYAAGTTPVTYPAAPPIIVNVIPVGA